MSRQNRFELLILFTSSVIAVVAWQFRLRFPFDDTFITFRYAEHLFAGNGLVWNIGGPHTEGYTNFLFVLLLALCRFFTSDLLAASQIIGLVCTVVTTLALYRIAASIRDPMAGAIAGAFYLAAPLTWINALSGMETSLFVMLVALSLWAYDRRSVYAAYLLLTLAALTRPEGAILGAIFFFLSAVTTRRNAIAPFAIACVLPLLLYALWKYEYFGDLLPNSFYIKVSEAHTRFAGLQYVRLFFTSSLVLLVASIGIRFWRAVPVLLAALLWIFTIGVFYIFVTPLEGLYDRFLWPVFTALCITAAIGSYDIAKRLHVRALPWGIVLLALAFMLQGPRTKQSLTAHEDVWDRTMDSIATTLHALPLSASITLAYGDAGYVVYRSGMQHLDLFGLNNTRIAHAGAAQERAAIVRAASPDLLLLPIADSAQCSAFVEDAYGIARESNYHPIASCNVFPYRLALMLNLNSAHALSIDSALNVLIANANSIWKIPPTICHSTR